MPAATEIYTQPELRNKLKEKIKKGNKGGPAGKWSARKAQLLVKTYESLGGGYKNTHTRTASQKSLREWGKNENKKQKTHKI